MNNVHKGCLKLHHFIFIIMFITWHTCTTEKWIWLKRETGQKRQVDSYKTISSQFITTRVWRAPYKNKLITVRPIGGGIGVRCTSLGLRVPRSECPPACKLPIRIIKTTYRFIQSVQGTLSLLHRPWNKLWTIHLGTYFYSGFRIYMSRGGGGRTLKSWVCILL